MNYIGRPKVIPTYSVSTPAFTQAPGIWNMNEVHSKVSGLGAATSGHEASSWPQSQTRTLTYRTNTTGSGTTTALTLTHPVGVTTGDLCVLFHAAYDADLDKLLQGPTGFSIIHPTTGYNYSGNLVLSLCVSYIVLTSTSNVTLPLVFDSNNFTGSQAPGNQAFIALYFYMDNAIHHIRRVPFFRFPNNSATNPASITIDSGQYPQACPLLALGSVISNTATNLGLSATSPAFDNVIINTAATNIELAVGYKIYNSAPADIVVDTDSTTTTQRIHTELLSIRSL